MNILSTDQIIDAFARLKAEDPEKFYKACGYGDQGVNVTHPFVSGSYELGLITGAKYALEHFAGAGLKDQLIDEVRKMRQLQKEYFRTRSHETLAASKSSESRVDKLLAELETPNLFEQ